MRMRWSGWLGLIAAAYAAGYLTYPPRALLINDEERYVAQALAFARGDLTLPGANAFGHYAALRVASDYPPGTSLLQAPLVWAAGWPAAGFLSVLALAGLMFATQRLLRAAGRPEGYAFLVPAYAGALLFGRIAMSDMPTAALVAVAMWALFATRPQQPWSAFLAGLATGASLLFREPTMVLLAPFVVGVLVRRRAAPLPLLAGIAVPLVVRLLLAAWLFDNPFFMRESGYRFSSASVVANAGVYALVLLALVPLGAAWPWLYRGPLRAEMTIACAAYLLMFLAYDYRPWHENGMLRGTVLATRFVLPLLPLLALAAADVVTRRVGRPWSGARWSRRLPGIVAGALAVLAAVVHPAIRRLERAPAAVVSTLAGLVPDAATVVVNERAAGKYMSPVYAARHLRSRDEGMPGPDGGPACPRGDSLYVVLLDRHDSPLFREDAAQNEAFLAAVAERGDARLLHDGEVGGMRLRVLTLPCVRV